MNNIEDLRDYLISDEIIRISSLSKVELISELIDIKSKVIENLSEVELLSNRK